MTRQTLSDGASDNGRQEGTMLGEDTLYLGDNGRAFCGKPRCAGMTASYTGRDLSGQKVEAITAREAIDHGIKCEGCGFQPRLVVAA